MKKKGVYFLILILILCSFSVLVSINPLFKNQDDTVDRNIIPYFSASDSHAYQWHQIYGGYYDDKGYGVAIDNSNNVYLAGYTSGADYWDMCLVKYDSTGEKQWDRRWNDEDYGAVHSYGVAVDSSENIYLAGMAYLLAPGHMDMVLVKYNNSGDQQWNCTWGGSNDDVCNGVAVDSANNVYLAGYTNSFAVGGSDMVLVKYDSDGVQLWNSTWGGSDDDVCNGVTVDLEDNVYLAGTTDSFGKGKQDMVLVKFESNGQYKWNRTWGWIEDDMGQGAAIDSSNNVYFAGSTNYYESSGTDMVLVKYNSSG
ncbi:MAG: SBBP repeat-containing protein, partial [Candidatus Thorarchaeota archaeon]